MTVVTRSIPSPIGHLLLVGDGECLHGLFMTRQRYTPSFDGAVEADDAFAEAARQLDEWFGGRRRTFELDVRPRGSAFQMEVWDVLRGIPFGATMTYGEVARRVARPGSARAIGSAVGRNPVGIVIPCHRVVGAGGALTGYAAGLDRKRWLLDHERRYSVGAAGELFAGAVYQRDGSPSSPGPKK